MQTVIDKSAPGVSLIGNKLWYLYDSGENLKKLEV